MSWGSPRKGGYHIRFLFSNAIRHLRHSRFGGLREGRKAQILKGPFDVLEPSDQHGLG
jgi:hypothetical protein